MPYPIFIFFHVVYLIFCFLSLFNNIFRLNSFSFFNKAQFHQRNLSHLLIHAPHSLTAFHSQNSHMQRRQLSFIEHTAVYTFKYTPTHTCVKNIPYILHYISLSLLLFNKVSQNKVKFSVYLNIFLMFIRKT